MKDIGIKFYFQSDRLKEFNIQLLVNYVIQECKIGNKTTFCTKMYYLLVNLDIFFPKFTPTIFETNSFV
nr:unnamed protein product [Callosobruchus chinensis]